MKKFVFLMMMSTLAFAHSGQEPQCKDCASSWSQFGANVMSMGSSAVTMVRDGAMTLGVHQYMTANYEWVRAANGKVVAKVTPLVTALASTMVGVWVQKRLGLDKPHEE